MKDLGSKCLSRTGHGGPAFIVFTSGNFRESPDHPKATIWRLFLKEQNTNEILTGNYRLKFGLHDFRKFTLLGRDHGCETRRIHGSLGIGP
jgi:hypothetical protein